MPPEVGQGRRACAVTAAALPTGGRDDPTGPSHRGHLCPGPSPWPPLRHVRRAPSLYSNFHPQPLRAASLGTTPHPFAAPLALDFLLFRPFRVMPARLLVRGRRPTANSKPREGGSTAGLLATRPRPGPSPGTPERAKTYLMKEMIHEPFFINRKVHSSFYLNFPGPQKWILPRHSTGARSAIFE